MAAVERYTVRLSQDRISPACKTLFGYMVGLGAQMGDGANDPRQDVLLIARIRTVIGRPDRRLRPLWQAGFFPHYRIVDNREAAEEILQYTFLRLWDRFERYDVNKGACCPGSSGSRAIAHLIFSAKNPDEVVLTLFS